MDGIISAMNADGTTMYYSDVFFLEDTFGGQLQVITP
jgi:hypothetical protein